MELNKCMGCMEDFLGYPCPKCGFDPGQVRGNEYALPIQTILAGKYLVGRVLGQGGFGITYIGWDIALERKIAIKEYYPNGQANRAPGTQPLSWYTSDSALQAKQAGLEMFLKEARKMARVEDIPGVVKVKDLFRENNTAYIVMDFVEGETLKTRLQRTGPMSWDQAKDIFRPAIQAMAAVHQVGLIHRDLSPDNLMLTKNGNVKILDLGAAKDLNINSGASSMQVAKGGFSPFEQYTQRGGSGPWTDVYAMAATVYYTLTGTLPPAAMDRVEEDTIRWDLPGLDTLPEPALEALKAALAVSAKKRTQSMEALEQGLFAAKPEAAPVTESADKPEAEQKPKVKVESPKPEKKGSQTAKTSRKSLKWWVAPSKELLLSADWKVNAGVFILTLAALFFVIYGTSDNLPCLCFGLFALIGLLFGPGSCLAVGLGLCVSAIGQRVVSNFYAIVFLCVVLPVFAIGLAGKCIQYATERANRFAAAGICAAANTVLAFLMNRIFAAAGEDYSIVGTLISAFLINLVVLMAFAACKSIRKPK